MIKSRRERKRAAEANKTTVWAESNDKGGFIIFCGIKGTEVKTIVGGCSTRDMLEYNIRKAKHKMGIKL